MQIIPKAVTVRAATKATGQARILGGLVLIFGLALLLRTTALGYDLPNIYHPDEPIYINIIQSIYQGDLNPHFFNYPTLFFYLNALAYLPYFGFLRLIGQPVAVLPVESLVMGVTLTQTPEAVLVSRAVSILFGVGAIGWLFLIGRRLTGNPWVGLMAALLLAISPTAIKLNRFITPDTFVVFFTLAAVYFSLRLYREGRQRDYLLAGICAGLAASSKYNAGLVVLVVLFAHFLRYGWEGSVKFEIYRAVVACSLAFLLCSPFILLDAPEFWNDFTYEARHYATGHAGMEGNTLNWYLSYLWRVEGVGVVLGGFALVAGFLLSLPGLLQKPRTASISHPGKREASAERFKAWLVVFAFPLLYFTFISRFVVRNDRTLFPVIPFLLLAAALLITVVLSRAGSAANLEGVSGDATLSKAANVRLANGAWLAAGLIAFALALAVPVLTLAQYAQVVNQPVPVVQARQWINANLPPGTHIVIESYAPYLDPQQYQVTPLVRAITRDPEWYRSEGIEYIVFSKSMFGRFYCDPVRYYLERAQYERLFQTFDEVAVFTNPVTTGPVTALSRSLGDRSLCAPQSELIYTTEVRILKVR
jgi:4-amino-4-deoxy-L-arabinose transferase-like glycosyltransferase